MFSGLPSNLFLRHPPLRDLTTWVKQTNSPLQLHIAAIVQRLAKLCQLLRDDTSSQDDTSPTYSFAPTVVSLGLERLGTGSTWSERLLDKIKLFVNPALYVIIVHRMDGSHLQVSDFVNSSPSSAFPLVRHLPNGQTIPLLPSPVQMTSVISVSHFQNLEKNKKQMIRFKLF